MAEAYYFKILDTCEFLKCYTGIYEGDYNKARARKILSLIPGLERKKVMDVGCGDGFYSLGAFNQKCRDVTLVDLSPVCVKAARMNPPEKISLKPEGVVAVVTHIPFRNVLISSQNSNSVNYILEAPIKRYIRKNKRWMGWDPNHLRFYTPKSLSLLLNNCGFAPIEVSGTYFVPYLIKASFSRVNQKLSSTLYYIMKLINDKLEITHKIPSSTFDWGIIYLCSKMKKPCKSEED